MAQKLAKKESVDFLVIELAALLHDIADWKFYDGDETVGPRVASEFLKTLFIEKKTIDHVCQIIKTVSFKGAGVNTPMQTLEGMIVQDADRLDAIGAIGIARCFAYGGYKGNQMHSPEQKVVMHESAQNYKKNRSSSINHFYEKLFLLKDRMNTKAGYTMAHERHQFMQQFLDRFKKEWDGIL